MSGYIDVFTASALAVIGLMTITWILSLILRDASIVDIIWGFGFVIIAVVSYLIADGTGARRLLLLVLPGIWGLRLTGYLAWRNIGKGEDPRYQAMRRRHGDRFWLVSIWLVFGMQAAIMWIVSLPVQVGMVPAEPGGLGFVELLGVAVWALGLFFETVGDVQLARFKADPANAGQVMDRGLWRYTRHPNYFGDFCVWWGIWLVAAATGVGLYTVIGPVLMTWFLLRVSGVALLERTIGKRREGYDEYVARTNAFFPAPPRSL